MTKTLKVLLSVLISLNIILVVLLVSPKQVGNLGSVERSGEYQSTTTSATFAVAPAFKVLKSEGGTLGSAVVTIAGAGGVINFYDATTTGPHSNHATTTLASLSTATAGTYTFDVVFFRGLVVETIGANTGTTTITYR